jgi:hypothetical protein
VDWTEVEVSFDFERADSNTAATPILEALDDPVQNELVEVLEAEAVSRCARRFPYLNWVGRSEAVTGANIRAKLEIRIKAQPGMGWTVYLECTKTVEGELRGTVKATLYNPDDYLPDRLNESQQIIKSDVLRRCREGLVSLIPDTSTLDKGIPLAETIHVGSNCLILPILAEELNASSDSKLRVEFEGNVPNETPEEGIIELRPIGRVLVQGDLFEMQKCLVTYFLYLPDEVRTWHQRIPEVLQYRAPDSTRIYMMQYSQKEERIVSKI